MLSGIFMKKVFLFLISTSFIMSSCVDSNLVKKRIDNDMLKVSNNNLGASIPLTISFSSFKTKDSTGSVAPKTPNDIHAVKIYLTSSNATNPLSSSNLKFTSPLLVYPSGQASKTYTFSNIPEGTYFAAVELFEDSVASINIIEPITYDSALDGDTAYNYVGGKRGLTLSTNSVTVTAPSMTFTFSDSSNEFKISPKLLSRKGASLDVGVNVSNGGNSYQGVIGFQ
jgi:hypothetical protein